MQLQIHALGVEDTKMQLKKNTNSEICQMQNEEEVERKANQRIDCIWTDGPDNKIRTNESAESF